MAPFQPPAQAELALFIQTLLSKFLKALPRQVDDAFYLHAVIHPGLQPYHCISFFLIICNDIRKNARCQASSPERDDAVNDYISQLNMQPIVPVKHRLPQGTMWLMPDGK